MSYKQEESRLEDAMAAYDKAIGGDGAILTGWVVIAEFMDADGCPRLETWAAEGIPYWRINGMVQAAAEEVFYVEEGLDDD